MDKKEIMDFLSDAEITVKIIFDDEVVGELHKDFLEWLEVHREGGGSPYVILFPESVDRFDERRVEIIIRKDGEKHD